MALRRVGRPLPTLARRHLAGETRDWPRVGLGYTYTYTYTSTSYVYTSTVTGYSVPLSLTLPVLWHPAGYFFVGAAPAFVTQLVNKGAGVSGPKTTDYGITGLIGGAIGAK